MYVAALRIELRIRGVQSLKEKRHIVKSVIAHLTGTFGVAVSEVDDQDKWQKATLGVAAVAPQASQLTRVLHTVRRAVEGRDDVEVLRIEEFHLEDPG
jgi:uncharacterized protein YlxP (DUF503 family)